MYPEHILNIPACGGQYVPYFYQSGLFQSYAGQSAQPISGRDSSPNWHFNPSQAIFSFAPLSNIEVDDRSAFSSRMVCRYSFVIEPASPLFRIDLFSDATRIPSNRAVKLRKQSARLVVHSPISRRNALAFQSDSGSTRQK